MTTLNGLPAHILLVHAVVVLLPLCAVVLVATAVWPAARRKVAGPNAALAVLTLALVPLTTGAGEWLQERVAETDLVSEHVELGDTALYVAVPVAVLALVVWWRGRERDAHDAGGTAASHAPTPGAGRGSTAVATPPRTTPQRRSFLAPTSTVVTRVVAAAAVLAATAAVVDVYLIGDSGARASWQDRTSLSEPAATTGSDGD